MRVLIIKMSSMGDVIHTLPALTDARQAIPNIIFDWLVEESLQEIPRWHPAVDKIIPVALRKWRRNLTASIKNGDVKAFIHNLRAQRYDLVIDAQGLLKSALLAKVAHAQQTGGLSWKSARESLASLFYNKRATVAKNKHAILKIRTLFADLLGYKLPPGEPDYGVEWHKFLSANLLSTPAKTQPYLLFLHGTTWSTKHWPDTYWQQLASIAGNNGFEIRMTWATAEQKARVQHLAEMVSAIKMLPHLSLNEAVVELLGAKGVVAVDTGFGHLAAALGIPAVSLYGPTNPKQIGTIGLQQTQLQATLPCIPCSSRKCIFNLDKALPFPPCMIALDPRLVWGKLMAMLS